MDELVVQALTEIGKTTILIGSLVLVLVLVWAVKESIRNRE